MSAQPASFTRSISNAAWSFARNINSILPHGKLPQPSWAPEPASQKLGADSNGDRRSKANPVTLPRVQSRSCGQCD